MTTQAPAPSQVRTPSFSLGVRVSLACNGLVLIALYSVVSYQRDIRSRIPFLLGIFSPSTWLGLFVITAAIGLVGLAITKLWNRDAIFGALVGSLLALLVFYSGVLNRLIPAGYESSPKWVWFGAAVLVVGLTLWRVRAGRLTRA